MNLVESLVQISHCTAILLEAVSDLERKKATERMQEKMAAAFRVQGVEVLKGFERFRRHFVEAGLESAIESMLDGALRVNLPEMTKDFTETGLMGYEWGYGDLQKDLGLQGAFSLSHPDAVAWAENNAAVRVAGVNNTTKKDIRSLITYGLDEGESYGEVQRSIKRQFEQFAVGSPLHHIQSRAELVAVTEMGEAYEAGAARLSDELEAYGVKQEKSRVGPDDDHTSDACRADLAAGWIPKEQPFPSGIMSGLEHPGCRHGTIYRVAREGEAPGVTKGTAEPAGGPLGAEDRARAKKIKEDYRQLDDRMDAEVVKYKKHLDAGNPPASFNWDEYARLKDIKSSKMPCEEIFNKLTDEEWLWLDSLTKEELTALRAYQGGSSSQMRAYMAGRALANPRLEAEAAEKVKHIESALKRAPNYSGTTYRGLAGLSDDAREALTRVGETIRWDAITSSSTAEGIAMDFSAGGRGLIFKITNKTGVDFRSIAMEGYRFEKEVLLRKGAKYRIMKVEDIGGVKPLVHLEEIP